MSSRREFITLLRRGGGVADGGGRPAAGDAGDRLSSCRRILANRETRRRISQGLEGARLRRGPERRDRISLGREPIRSAARIGGDLIRRGVAVIAAPPARTRHARPRPRRRPFRSSSATAATRSNGVGPSLNRPGGNVDRCQLTWQWALGEAAGAFARTPARSDALCASWSTRHSDW